MPPKAFKVFEDASSKLKKRTLKVDVLKCA